MLRRQVRIPVEQLQPTERDRIVCLQEAGWHIDGLLHMLGTMYLWCVAALSSSLWNIPTPVDQDLDGRVVQAHVKIAALREQRWPPKQHPIRVRVAPV